MVGAAQLRVIGTDPGWVKEFRMFAQQGDFEILDLVEEPDRFIYLLRKP